VAQGGEFLVNTTTASNQVNASVAMDADGDFVVAWQSYGHEADGAGYGIYAQRYNAAGLAQGDEFLVNTTIANDQRNASVAIDADGDFVVVWQSFSQDGASYGIYAQRYNAAGVAQGGEFRVNAATDDSQSSASVTMDEGGDFVVTWHSYGQDGSSEGIYAQRYNAAGVAQGGEFLVNTTTANSQSSASVAMDDGGDFVVAWQSYGQDGDGDGIFMARFDADGDIAPSLDLDISAPGTGFSALFVQGEGPVAISDTDVGLAGSARVGFGFVTVRLSGALDGTAESLSLTGTHASVGGGKKDPWDPTTGTLTIVIAEGAPLADVQAVIAAIRYNNTSDAPTEGDRTVAVFFSGGIGDLNSTNTAVSTITIAGRANQAPTALALSAATVDENAAGATIGTLSVTDPDDGDSHDFTVSDNRFEVVAGVLKLKEGESLDHEAAASVTVDVTAEDAGGLTFTDSFVITVTDVNDAPTALALSAATVDENALGATIGTLSVTDDDDSHDFTVSDNRFEVVAGVLKLKEGESLDHEAAASVPVDVTAEDAGGLTFTESFDITVANVNEAPKVTSGAAASFAENATGTVYQAMGSDPDAGTTLSWSLAGTDAALFDIDAATGAVTFKAAPNFEAPRDAGRNNIYDVTVTVSDGALSSGPLGVAITVMDVLDPLNRVGSAGADTLIGDALGDSLLGNDGDDSLIGLAGGDTLIGGVGNDTLKGGLGADSMVGGAGNDVYWIDDTVDVALESPSDGYDRVISTISWTLGDDLEWLSLSLSTGTAALNGTGNALANLIEGTDGANLLDGRQGHDRLVGRAGADTLLGGEGSDTLDGGLGADSMVGGAGNDTYVIDHLLDVALELAGGGTDQVNSALSWTLGDNMERLTLVGTAGLTGTGNNLSNGLFGNDGANRLEGLLGNDTLSGGAGADTLLGGRGNDVLQGGAGADSLVGGDGRDRFLFLSATEADGDVVADFSAAQGDTIDLRPMLTGDQTFIWIDSAGFSGVARELRFAAGILEGDLGGDGTADFKISLSNVASLNELSIWL
jgi:hypothetical protein